MATKKTAKKNSLKDEAVSLKPGPLTVTTALPADLVALGLPTACTGGEVLEDIEIDADEGTRRVVFRMLGLTLGVPYDAGDTLLPFGSGPVELTVMHEKKKRGGAREFVPVAQLA